MGSEKEKEPDSPEVQVTGLYPQAPFSPEPMSSLGPPSPLPDFGGMGPPTGTPYVRSAALHRLPPETCGPPKGSNGLSEAGSTAKDKEEVKKKRGLFASPFDYLNVLVCDRIPDTSKKTASALADWPIVLHVIFVIALTWLLGRLHVNGLLAIALMVLALHQIHVIQRQREKLRWQVEFRKTILANEAMTDEETTRWLNAALARAWPVFAERFMSVKIMPKLLPWFLQKFKPRPVKRLDIKGMNLGSEPPLITGARIYSVAADGNHVEMEMNVEMICGKDMFLHLVAHVGDAKWGLGLIPWNAYATDLQLLGRCQVGIRFLRKFPFIDRVSISFVGAPHVAMAVKVMGLGIAKGFDAAGLPVVAGYVDATLKRALKGSLVAPNKLVITDIAALLDDVIKETQAAEKALHDSDCHAGAAEGPPMDDHHPVAYVRLELIDGEQLISADRNGLSDPYVRGNLGPAKFHSSIKQKTLNPKWFEDYRIPVVEWGERMMLRMQVKDYDRFSSDDDLGWCEIDVKALTAGERHERWLKLEGVRTGRLHLAVTVEDLLEDTQVEHQQGVHETPTGDTANVQTKTVTKEGGVAMASAQLQPNEDKALSSYKRERAVADVRKEADIGKAAGNTDGMFTRRAVKLGRPSYQVAPGVQIYTWDD